MSHQLKIACVFCASSTKVDASYFQEAENLAHYLVEAGYSIKYGGGSVGLMGALANKALQLKGGVIGVIPQFMIDVEWQHPQVENMIVTDNMHQRKQELLRNIDAVVALPGSSGTLEELVEAISLKKLGLFTKPIVVVNTNGFYNSFVELMKRMADENFMRQEHLDAFVVVNHSGEVVNAIQNAPRWLPNAIEFAKL